MRALLPPGLFSLGVGYVLAHFLVALYSNWYFAELFWLKVGVLTPLIAACYLALLLLAPQRRVWLVCGWWWLASYAVAALQGGSLDLRSLGFTSVLDFEAAMVWLPVALLWLACGIAQAAVARRRRRAQRGLEHELASRRSLRLRLRRLLKVTHAGTSNVAMLCLSGAAAALALLLGASTPQPAAAQEAGVAPAGDEAEPWHLNPNRHAELKSPALRLAPEQPLWPSQYPVPAHLREREVFYLVLDNREGGGIWAVPAGTRMAQPERKPAPQFHAPAGLNWGEADADAEAGAVSGQLGEPQLLGHVIVPVSKVNPQGFTASGWAEPGTVCATAVNAIHVKTNHDYAAGRGVIFSILPVEQTEIDPAKYLSYLSPSTSILTDIPGGTQLFGGLWAPLNGSRVLYVPVRPDSLPAVGAAVGRDSAPATIPSSGGVTPPASAQPMGGGTPPPPDEEPTAIPTDIASARAVQPGWVPKVGDQIVIEVERRKYNPEWIEFENGFGGLVWVKEVGLDPYPIGQVLKPVAGVGRFLGTQYAGVGRVRANHPGVLCISTAPMGEIGGFQIIPRDHAMSSEMTFARVKTQWMVVGPLWALDPSWEGTAPLFSDYFYPCFTPALNPDGSVSEDVHGAQVFLDRFTVRARYSDSADPAQYELIHPASGLKNDAFTTLTHLRIYFPRG